MSLPSKKTVTCPHCQAAFTVTMWNSVNTNLSADLRSRIISGEFFEAKCPVCGFIPHLEYDTLYHDMKHGAMIWVIHEHESGCADTVGDVFETNLLEGYMIRVVKNMNQLREKVAALEAGRDDRIIELCKVYLKYTLEKQLPDFKTVNAFYTYSSGKEMVFFYDDNGKELQCYLEDNIYQKIASIFATALLNIEGEIYTIYDAEWAEEFFESAPKDDI